MVDDPPLSSFDTVARVAPAGASTVNLPSCSQYQGPTATFCRQLEAALLSLLSATRRAQAVAAAMRTTVARETGALSARNGAAAARQDRALGVLLGRFTAAPSAETTAGEALQSLMAPTGLPSR